VFPYGCPMFCSRLTARVLTTAASEFCWSNCELISRGLDGHGGSGWAFVQRRKTRKPASSALERGSRYHGRYRSLLGFLNPRCRSAHPAPSRMESPSRQGSVNPRWAEAHPALRTCGVSRCGSFPPAGRHRPRLRTLKAPVLYPSAAWGARSSHMAGLSASIFAGCGHSFQMC
jgi:hypothetical protein